MKKSKTGLDYIATKEERVVLSVKVRKSLYQQIEELREKEGATWVDLVDGVFRKLLSDVRAKT